MPDQTARDAARVVVEFGDPAVEFTYGCRLADAVLAVLGIPPDTTTDTIRAGLALVESFRAIFKWSDGSGPGRNFVKVTYDDATREWVAYTSGAHGFAWGTSPAAAVNALAAKLEDDR